MNQKRIDKNILRKLLESELPGKIAHEKMLPPGRRMTANEKGSKKSAVLVLFIENNEKTYICFTQRASAMKHHPGQISFPGGRMEKHEKLASTTAIRESNEEIGTVSDEIEIIGELTPIYISVSNFLTYPVVGWAKKMPNFIINKDEVDELILLPVEHFLCSESIGNTIVDTITGQLNVPCFLIHNYTIWGATAMIISELVMLLKSYYSHREEYSDNDNNGQVLQ